MTDSIHTIEEYFRINIEKKLLIHFPEEDEHQLTTGTRLLEIRRQMQEVDQGLAAQKEEYTSKMESIEQRRADLRAKQGQLKESLEKFDKFLKENDAKKSRALKKSVEERKIREQKENELQKLRSTMSQLTKRRDNQSLMLDRDILYQHFLECALEAAQDFDEIKDLVARYETLVATYHDLMERAGSSQEKMEQERSKLVGLTEHKNNILLGYNNELARLQTLLEEKQKVTMSWQNKYDTKVATATQKSLLLGQVRLVTSNLFNLIKVHRNLQNLSSHTDTITQLKKIQQTVLDLTEIVEEMKLTENLYKMSLAAGNGSTANANGVATAAAAEGGQLVPEKSGNARGEDAENSVAGSTNSSLNMKNSMSTDGGVE